MGKLAEGAIEQSCFCWQLKTKSQTEFAESTQLQFYFTTLVNMGPFDVHIE